HIANVLGITTENAQEMLKSGEISMEESLDYFVDAVEVGSEGAGGYFAKMEGTAQKAGDTMQGAWVNLKASVAQLGEDMWESGAWDVLKDGMADLTQFIYDLQPALEPVAERVAIILATMVDWIQKMLIAFVNLSPKMQTIIGLISVIGAVIGPVIFAFGSFVGIAGQALKPFGALFGVLSKVFGILGKKGLLGAIGQLGSRFSILLGPVGIIIGLFTTLYLTSETFRKVVKQVIGSLIDFGKTIWEAIQPSIKAVVDSFKQMIKGFKGTKDGIGGLGDSLSPLLQILGALGKLVGGVLVTAFGVFMSIISGVMRAIGPLVNGFLDLLNMVTNFFMAFVSMVYGDFDSANEYMEKAVKNSVDFIVNMFKSLIGFIMGFVDAFLGFFKGLYDKLVGNSIIPDMVNAIVEWFVKLKEWSIDLIKGMVRGVINWFKGLLTGTIEIFTNIWDFINKVWNKTIEFVLFIAKSIVNGVIQWWNNLLNNTKKIFNFIWTFINGLWNRMLDF